MDNYIERPSRAEKKRDREVLRQLVVTLVGLSAGQFAKLELSEDLHKALVEARRLSSPNAKRRQILFAAGLIDEEDAANIRASVRSIDLPR